LELVMGDLLARGGGQLWATGALGSNHALATAIHAPRVGLEAGAILWPQPATETSKENLRALLGSGCELRLLPSIIGLPLAGLEVAVGSRLRGRRDLVMAPGAASPLGALGHLSAGLELAYQVARGELPHPRHVVLPVGSTCTTAGLLVGLWLARHLGIGFGPALPLVHAVRVTPWPVTAPWRILDLARRTARFLAVLGGPRLDLDAQRGRSILRVEAHCFGRGYAHPTAGGLQAIQRFRGVLDAPLDTTYSAKAAAFLLEAARRLEGPVLFWATKSSVPLPAVHATVLASAPRAAREWLERAYP
jgi:D-cysteine desulfhydrase